MPSNGTAAICPIRFYAHASDRLVQFVTNQIPYRFHDDSLPSAQTLRSNVTDSQSMRSSSKSASICSP